MEISEVVMKLIGEIEPIGETHTDTKRLENLQNLTALVDEMLEYIQEVAENEMRPEHSRAVAGRHAAKFLKYIREEYNPNNKHYI